MADNEVEAELMDVNERIRMFEEIAYDLAQILRNYEKDASGIHRLAIEMEELRKKMDKDIEDHKLKSFIEDAEKLDQDDEVVEEHLIKDLKDQAVKIDQELSDIVSKVEQ